MTEAVSKNNEINRYWSYIKNASDEIKINLISLLSDSLISKKGMDKDVKELATDDEKATDEFLKKFAGAWNGAESPEDLISIIRKNRSISNPPKI